MASIPAVNCTIAQETIDDGNGGIYARFNDTDGCSIEIHATADGVWDQLRVIGNPPIVVQETE